MTLPYDLNILDVVLLSVIALFTLRGALRGFLDEVAGLVGILGGVWLAGRYYGELGRIFSQYTTSQWVYIVAYVLILCMVMFVISMISRALHSFLKMAYADWINHLAGAAVGGLKGFLICAVMVTLLTYFINDADFIKKSRTVVCTAAYKQRIAHSRSVGNITVFNFSVIHINPHFRRHFGAACLILSGLSRSSGKNPCGRYSCGFSPNIITLVYQKKHKITSVNLLQQIRPHS